MNTDYKHMATDERNEIQRGLNFGLSCRAIARQLNRAPSSITREIGRNAPSARSYDAQRAVTLTRARCRRGARKLPPDSPLFACVCDLLGQSWSPQQIAGRLRHMRPDEPGWHLSHETIYCALYALPRGEWRRELIAQLRCAHKSRKSRSGGKDRRGSLPNMTSIHLRPVEVAARQVPGHWEGDLIKGAGNRSSVGTLVERKSRYVILAKMTDASAQATLEAFTRRFRHVPACVRKSLTYDQGREMAYHEPLAKHLKINVFFADPHSPWQRPTNENMNGLIREYLPKGLNLSQFSQGYLNAIADQLNNRPRRCLNYETPFEVYSREISNLQHGVALQN
jgi:IS30 family transposase